MASLNYERLSKKPRIFLRLTGVSVDNFRKIVNETSSEWQSKVVNMKKSPAGRSSNLKTLEDKVMVLFIYYRTYITHEFLGYLVGLHNCNICRLFKILEPLVAKKVTIKKDRSLVPEEILKIIADVTEQPTQRPSKKQKKYYSGKKKRHSMKTEIVINDTGKILSVSKTSPGRKHDFRIRKEDKPLPPFSEKYVDSGYQGLQKITTGVTLPYKGAKKKPLTQERKIHNKKLSSFRVKVEHKIRQLKVFKILRETYRNFQKKYNMRFNIIAGIVNLNCGF